MKQPYLEIVWLGDCSYRVNPKLHTKLAEVNGFSGCDIAIKLYPGRNCGKQNASSAMVIVGTGSMNRFGQSDDTLMLINSY